MKTDTPLITTIGERCRMCYTCVRDCPAKAIRIHGGQAEVLGERCIGCGNCVRVCSQHAKQFYDSRSEVEALLSGPAKVAALLAPSFPAEFADIEPERLAAMVRALGFDLVCEVAHGADRVATRYRRLLQEHPGRRFIATTCPAVVAFVEKYHPACIPHLAPICSPMIAEARALRELHGQDLKTVFIGPCLAKKVEGARSSDGQGPEIDAVLTFVELRRLLEARGLAPDRVEPDGFDPPHPGLGALFSISRGMLQAAHIREDLLANNVVAAEGKGNFSQAIREFEEGALDVRLLEVLCCDGCIMGPGMSVDTPLFRRRSAVSRYVRGRAGPTDAHGESVDLSMRFEADEHPLNEPGPDALAAILKRMGKTEPEDELNCGACGYETCREHAIAIFRGLAESEMCLPYTIERLKQSLEDLHLSNEQLASTRQALLNAEKLASMGQLAAGIAHEVNNPLGVILLFAKTVMEETRPEDPHYEDLKMIGEQADRCKKIVSGLLDFARQNKVQHQSTDLIELVNHCLKALVLPPGVRVRTRHEMEDPTVELDPDQMIQVLTNLAMNAVEAMNESGELEIVTRGDARQVRVEVRDTGSGIAPEHLTKIFEPFFTTKRMGKGTGLGLAVIYGIVKMHKGTINVVSNNNPEKGPTGTTFTVTLPRRRTMF